MRFPKATIISPSAAQSHGAGIDQGIFCCLSRQSNRGRAPIQRIQQIQQIQQIQPIAHKGAGAVAA